jgi:predicted kinase
MIVLMAGLPGSGKTTLAHELARRTAGLVLNKDEIRAVLFPAAEIEFSTEQDDFCMSIVMELASYVLRKNPLRMVFVDGRPFSRRYQIEHVTQAAERMGQPWRILHCVCSEASARERLSGDDHIAGNRDFTLYLKVKESFEAIEQPQTFIDTDRPLENCLEQSLEALR